MKFSARKVENNEPKFGEAVTCLPVAAPLSSLASRGKPNRERPEGCAQGAAQGRDHSAHRGADYIARTERAQRGTFYTQKTLCSEFRVYSSLQQQTNFLCLVIHSLTSGQDSLCACGLQYRISVRADDRYTGVPAPLNSWRISLSTLQASQGEHPMPVRRDLAGAINNRVPVARQQLAVEAADRCELGRGVCWVRDYLQDVALQRQDENSATLHLPVFIRDAVIVFLDEVEAVLCKTEPQG